MTDRKKGHFDSSDISLICPGCGKAPGPDPKMSNDNWKVFDPDCKYCGAKLEMKIAE